jgi:OHCU decarboxylase
MTTFGKHRPSEIGRAAFLERYGGVYEHSPWIAAAAWDKGAVADDAGRLAEAMAAEVEAADHAAQLALLRAHPDLAGRLGIGEALTAASSAEQAGAGLDRCTPEEFSELTALNESYKARFGFPFILAVKGRAREEILAIFRRRVQNDPATEFREALDQVHRIARLRLIALAEDQ